MIISAFICSLRLWRTRDSLEMQHLASIFSLKISSSSSVISNGHVRPSGSHERESAYATLKHFESGETRRMRCTSPLSPRMKWDLICLKDVDRAEPTSLFTAVSVSARANLWSYVRSGCPRSQVRAFEPPRLLRSLTENSITKLISVCWVCKHFRVFTGTLTVIVSVIYAALWFLWKRL